MNYNTLGFNGRWYLIPKLGMLIIKAKLFGGATILAHFIEFFMFWTIFMLKMEFK